MAALKQSFGLFDGDACTWTGAAAWVHTNGVWYENESFRMWQEARPMTEAEWTKAFPGVLETLPKEAFQS